MPIISSKFKVESLKLNSGFTLIELLVVFSIVSVLAGIGFVSLAGYSRSQTLTQAAADVKQAVETARFNSLSNVKTSDCSSQTLSSYIVNFCPNNQNTSCPAALYTKGYQVQEVCGAQSFPVLVKTLPNNVTFTPGSTCRNLTFSSISGGATNSVNDCILGITAYGKVLNVTINPQGYVSY